MRTAPPKHVPTHRHRTWLHYNPERLAWRFFFGTKSLSPAAMAALQREQDTFHDLVFIAEVEDAYVHVHMPAPLILPLSCSLPRLTAGGIEASR